MIRALNGHRETWSKWRMYQNRQLLSVHAGALAPQAATHRMHWRERYQRTLDLWPYMVPLTLVYFAEYVMQVR